MFKLNFRMLLQNGAQQLSLNLPLCRFASSQRLEGLRLRARPVYQILQTNIWMNISDDQTLVQPQYLQRQQLHPLKFWLTFSRVGSGCGHLKLKWRCLFWIPGPSIKKDLFWEHWRWISLDLLPTSSPGQIAWQLLAWVWSIHGWCFLTWNKTFKARRKSCQIAPRMGGGVL